MTVSNIISAMSGAAALAWLAMVVVFGLDSAATIVPAVVLMAVFKSRGSGGGGGRRRGSDGE